MTDPVGPLHLSGELTLEVDGIGVQVHADGGDVRLQGLFRDQARQLADHLRP